MFKNFSDIHFIVYKLYYVSQNNDLGIRVRLRNWNGGSTFFRCSLMIDYRLEMIMKRGCVMLCRGNAHVKRKKWCRISANLFRPFTVHCILA
jgi:hypothetical protein